MAYLRDTDAQRALRVLRCLYVILREVYDDEVPRGLAERGQRLRDAVDAGDRRAAHDVACDVAEWLRRNRHLINRRIELSFPELTEHPAGYLSRPS